MPGDARAPFEYANQARQVLNDAEDDLREWQPEHEEVGSPRLRLDNNLVSPLTSVAGIGGGNESRRVLGGTADEGSHHTEQNDAGSRAISGGSVTTGPVYATSESEAGTVAH